MATRIRLRPNVTDHTLVRLVPGSSSQVTGHGGPDEMTTAAFQLLADTAQPMSVLELAARLSLPRAVAATIITDLSTQHLVQLSSAHPPREFARQARLQHQVPVSKRCPGLVSAKVTVVGPRGTGTSTYVGAASDHAPIRTVETAHHDGELISLSLELGAIEISPTSRLHLLAAPAPTAFDAFWPGVVRSALGVLVVVHPHRSAEAIPTLLAVQDAALPYQVVVNHLDGTDPAPDLVSATLDVAPDRVTVADARSRPATRSVLNRLLRRLEDAS